MSKANVLVVEDELIIALSIQKSLEKLGYTVIGMASTGEDAVRKTLELQPDLVLLIFWSAREERLSPRESSSTTKAASCPTARSSKGMDRKRRSAP